MAFFLRIRSAQNKLANNNSKHMQKRKKKKRNKKVKNSRNFHFSLHLSKAMAGIQKFPESNRDSDLLQFISHFIFIALLHTAFMAPLAELKIKTELSLKKALILKSRPGSL